MAARLPVAHPLVDRRVLGVCLLAIVVAVAAGLVAQGLQAAIALVTHVAFFHEIALTPVSPGDNTLGLGVVAVPVVGALIIGGMARYGSPAIRGHGIPEAMEKILLDESRIPAPVAILKPP